MTNPGMQTQLSSPQPPSGAVSPKTTEVMVILTAKPGVSREQIMKIMPAEIRATVRLYLEGKIRQWYSRGDGRGVVFFLDAELSFLDATEKGAKHRLHDVLGI